MSAARRALDGQGIALMMVLCVCWGLQQVAVKLAAPSMNPVMQMGVRSAIGALLVLGLMCWRRDNFSLRDGTFWPGVMAGLLFGAEFLCIALGLTFTSAAHMSVFLYTAPVFTVLGLQWLVPGERLHPRQWVGILLAFAGIAITFANGFSAGSGDLPAMLIGDALGVLAALMWAATTVLIRTTSLSETQPSKTLMYQLLVSAILLLAVAGSLGYATDISMTAIAWYSLFFQIVIVSFASYLAWFWILRTYLATRVSVFSFLTPLFGVGFGILLLNESVSTAFLMGAVLVLAGIVMVNVKKG